MKKCLFVLLVIAYCVASFMITYNVIDFQRNGDAGGNVDGFSLRDINPLLKSKLRINLFINKEVNGTEQETKISQDIEVDAKDKLTNYNIFLNMDMADIVAKASPYIAKTKPKPSRRLKGTMPEPERIVPASPDPSKDASKPVLSFSSIPHKSASVNVRGGVSKGSEGDRTLQDSTDKILMIEGAKQVKPCFYGNVDFRGADLQIRRTTSALACQLVCREREPKCKFFTWITQEHPDPHLHGICYMKLSEGGAAQAHGAISGPQVCSSAVDGQS